MKRTLRDRKRIAVVICNNGLGHLRRVSALLKEVLKKVQGGVFFDLYFDMGKKSFVDSTVFRSGRVSCIDVKCFEDADWPSLLKGYDLLWSDNYVFPFKYVEQGFLTGSFVWSEIDSTNILNSEENAILRGKKLTMIGNRYFSTPKVRTKTCWVPVGMYPVHRRKEGSKGTGILLSCGQSISGISHFDKHFPEINNVLLNMPEDVTLYVEPRYWRELPQDQRIKKADFSEQMYSSLIAAVIRPGMGSINDVLACGGRIFCFYEKNFEVRHNARVLTNLGVGESFPSVGQALQGAFAYVSDQYSQRKHANAVLKIDFDGVHQTTKHILSLVNS